MNIGIANCYDSDTKGFNIDGKFKLRLVYAHKFLAQIQLKKIALGMFQEGVIVVPAHFVD